MADQTPVPVVAIVLPLTIKLPVRPLPSRTTVTPRSATMGRGPAMLTVDTKLFAPLMPVGLTYSDDLGGVPAVKPTNDTAPSLARDGSSTEVNGPGGGSVGVLETIMLFEPPSVGHVRMFVNGG